MTPVCSVVIATHNRCNSLKLTLDSVLHQRLDAPYEVIVVDNASTDDTAAVVRHYLRRYAHLRYAFEPVSGPSATRNTGVALSSSDLIAFTDDDIRPAADWLASLVSAAAAHPAVDCFGGRILPDWPSAPPAWLTRDHWTGPLALQDYGNEPTVISRERPLSLASANLVIRRRTFEALGGFSPAYRYAEDTELLMRLWRAGCQCLYVPNAVVTADVQPERIHKAYHRRWHWRNGRWAARLGLEESFDGRGRLLDAPVDAPMLFGIRSFLFRQLFSDVWACAKATVRWRRSQAFRYEKHVWQMISYMRTCATERPRTTRGPASEISGFFGTLMRRKWPWWLQTRS